MKLIIDIPESIFDTIQADEMISREQLAILQIHILNGTPLPNDSEQAEGEWIEESDNYGHSSYFCSRCGTQEGKPSGFCPNCRARMSNSEKVRNNGL